jgi:hypothetical protein
MRCSYCQSLKKQGNLRMVDVKQELLKEWHPSLNMDLKANEVSVNQREKMWWICTHGHEWEATIRSRLRGNSCPFCGKVEPQVRSAWQQRAGATQQEASDHPPVSTPTGLAAGTAGLSASPIGVELRKSLRYARFETVMIEMPRSEILGYAQLNNFSAEGLMLFSDFAMHPGELIKIRFDKALHSSIPKIVTSRVVWCQDLEDPGETGSRFGIGLRLM